MNKPERIPAERGTAAPTLPGAAPQVRAFEESRKVVYHEADGFEPK